MRKQLTQMAAECSPSKSAQEGNRASGRTRRRRAAVLLALLVGLTLLGRLELLALLLQRLDLRAQLLHRRALPRATPPPRVLLPSVVSVLA